MRPLGTWRSVLGAKNMTLTNGLESPGYLSLPDISEIAAALSEKCRALASIYIFHCALIPIRSRMLLKTISIAWIILISGFALQYTITSCSASRPLRMSM
jgi:hypothetical protein